MIDIQRRTNGLLPTVVLLLVVGGVLFLLQDRGISGIMLMFETAPWETLATAGIALLLAIFALYLILEKDPNEAAKRTSDRAIGTIVGAGGVSLAAIAEGIHVVAELPAIIITLLGIGSIVAGISWELFGATALISYTVLAAVRGDY